MALELFPDYHESLLDHDHFDLTVQGFDATIGVSVPTIVYPTSPLI